MGLGAEGLFLLGAMAAAYGLRGEREPLATHGSAGWGTAETIPFANPPGDTLGVTVGYASGRAARLSWEETLQHGVILGPTGTGKSRAFFMPFAAQAQGVSLVCTDPKSELWRHTSGYHPQARRYAPCEPERSEGFNFIPLCHDPRRAQLLARAMVESGNTERTEQAWLDLETSFLAATFAHAATTRLPTPRTAYELFTSQSQEETMQTLLRSESEAARREARILQQASERMRGSYTPVVAARLQFLQDPQVARFTSATLTPPDFGRLRREPTALYFCLREQDIAWLRPLTSAFFALLLEALAEEESGRTPTLLLLDEFANIGAIPHFETTISLARGRGVACWLGVQSLSQMEARYGRQNAQTILTNCQTKVALHGLDVTTAEWVSRSLGDATWRTRRRSVRRWWGLLPEPTVTVSDQEHRRPLLTPDEVRRLPTDRAIVLTGNRRPLLLEKRYFSASPWESGYRHRLGAMQTLTWEKRPLEASEPAPEPPPEPPWSALPRRFRAS